MVPRPPVLHGLTCVTVDTRGALQADSPRHLHMEVISLPVNSCHRKLDSIREFTKEHMFVFVFFCVFFVFVVR